MITKQHSHYLKFLSEGYNLLLLSDLSYRSFDIISDLFDVGIQRKIDDQEYENLTHTLLSNKIDIVILDCSLDTSKALKFFEKIQSYESRIVIISILKKQFSQECYDILERSDEVLLQDFTINQLKDKIFTQLSLFYTIKSIGRRNWKIDSGSMEIKTNLDEFFDTYEGSSLFIVDDLTELNKALKSGELSIELFQKIAEKLKEIPLIFSKNTNTDDIAQIFENFAIFIKELDITSIEPQSLYAFDYICDIIDDTNEYIMDMFVDRVFKDTYIVKHSLENNIEFMKTALGVAETEESGELEFF